MRELARRAGWVTAVVLAVALIATLARDATGGSLNPPGTPGPTMKTLDQAEPRTPVESLAGDADHLHVIDQPGSYYLTGNLAGATAKSGILVTASGVTLDLSGFDLAGGAGSLDGIVIASDEVTVLHGTIRNWGGDGIDAANGSGQRIEGVTATGNGGNGLALGGSANVTACVAIGNVLDGVNAGSDATVNDCIASQNGGDGFEIYGGILTACISRANSGRGVVAGTTPGRVSGCEVSENGGDGIAVLSHTVVEANAVHANTAAGIHALVSSNEIRGNNVAGNAIGIDADSGGNIVIGNSAGHNGAPGAAGEYDNIVAGNVVGPLVSSANVAASTNAHANYIY